MGFPEVVFIPINGFIITLLLPGDSSRVSFFDPLIGGHGKPLQRSLAFWAHVVQACNNTKYGSETKNRLEHRYNTHKP